MNNIHPLYKEITDGASDATSPTQRENTVRVVLCADRAAWGDYVARAGGSLPQSWPWGAFKRQQGWRTLRLVAPRDRELCAAMQVLARRVPGVGAFLYAAEGPMLSAVDWASGAAALGPLLATVRRDGQGAGALAPRGRRWRSRACGVVPPRSSPRCRPRSTCFQQRTRSSPDAIAARAACYVTRAVTV